MRVTTAVVSALVALAALSAACSTSSNDSDAGTPTVAASFTCTSYGAHDCPADPAPAESAVSDCQAAEADPLCGSEATAALACEQAAHTCDANGQTDSPALQQSCATVYDAYALCVGEKEADGGAASSGIVATGYGNAGEGEATEDSCASVGLDDDDAQIDFGDPPCDQCMAEICCAPVTACAASASCRALAACVVACAAGDDSCSAACVAADPSASTDQTLYAAVDSCRTASCTSAGGVGSCN